MQCIGRLRSCFREPGGKYVAVFETDDPVTAQADAVRGKCLSISARAYRPPRSLSANGLCLEPDFPAGGQNVYQRTGMDERGDVPGDVGKIRGRRYG